jgi:hypothetical protein
MAKNDLGEQRRMGGSTWTVTLQLHVLEIEIEQLRVSGISCTLPPVFRKMVSKYPAGHQFFHSGFLDICAYHGGTIKSVVGLCQRGNRLNR